MSAPRDRELDRATVLQNTVRLELLERLQYFALAPRRILDLGCGTGAGAVALRQRYRSAKVFAVDMAEHMLAVTRRRGWLWRRPCVIAASATALPFAAGSFDLVFCSLVLQCCDEPQQVFAEIQRVLRPGGLLQFSTFGPETLTELRSAWSAADDLPHVSEPPVLPQLGAAMSAAGLAEPVLDRETHLRHYASVDTLATELRLLGGINAARTRRRTMTGRHRAAAMRAAYEQQRETEGLPVTFEIFYGAAFAGKGAASAGLSSGAGEIAIPVSSISRRSDRPP